MSINFDHLLMKIFLERPVAERYLLNNSTREIPGRIIVHSSFSSNLAYPQRI